MRMKKLTLDINERQEQEDYQGKKITKDLVFIFRGVFVDLQKVLFVMISSWSSKYWFGVLMGNLYFGFSHLLFPPWSLYLEKFL